MVSEQPLLTVGALVKQVEQAKKEWPAFLNQLAHALCEMTDRGSVAEAAWRTQQGTGRFKEFWDHATPKDPGLLLFSEVLKAPEMVFKPNQTVLEIGCCEANWIQPALKAEPTLKIVGIDWRAGPVLDGGIRIRGDARESRLFCPSQFDWVVSLSAIEHMGLGHYEQDPEDPDGDTAVMLNVAQWLRPGGHVYFDVPYSINGYAVHGTDYRIYDEEALQTRLLVGGLHEIGRGYSKREPIELDAELATNRDEEFVYCAILAQKADVLNAAGGCAPMVQS